MEEGDPQRSVKRSGNRRGDESVSAPSPPKHFSHEMNLNRGMPPCGWGARRLRFGRPNDHSRVIDTAARAAESFLRTRRLRRSSVAGAQLDSGGGGGLRERAPQERKSASVVCETSELRELLDPLNEHRFLA